MAHILYDEDITVDGLEVHVLRKTVKYGTITVGLDGRVTYSAPPMHTREQIEKHIREEMPWIRNTRRTMAERYDPDFKPEVVLVGDQRVPVLRRSVKRISVRVLVPSGDIEVKAPHDVPLDFVQRFATSRADKLLHSQQNVRAVCPPPLQYVDGEIHMVWGKKYVLKVEERNVLPDVRLEGDKLVLVIPPGAGRDYRIKLLRWWHKNEVLRALQTLVPKWEQTMGVRVDKYSSTYLKSRWGSCRPLTREIKLNSELARHPAEILEGVLIHELCHFLVPGHAPCFYEVLGKYCPGYEQVKAYLDHAAATVLQ